MLGVTIVPHNPVRIMGPTRTAFLRAMPSDDPGDPGYRLHLFLTPLEPGDALYYTPIDGPSRQLRSIGAGSVGGDVGRFDAYRLPKLRPGDSASTLGPFGVCWRFLGPMDGRSKGVAQIRVTIDVPRDAIIDRRSVVGFRVPNLIEAPTLEIAR